MQELTAILEFKAVSIRAGSMQTTGLADASFSLNRGELLWVMVMEGAENIPLAPLAQGLLTPDSGKVFFKGESWDEVGPGAQSLLRGRIRRVFVHYGWVTNLDMMENLCLAECHNTQRPIEEIKAEVRALARRFGVDEVPEARPTRVHPMILRKLEWVRAFVGDPELIILERPCVGAPKADAVRLTQAVSEAVRRGVAVMWVSDEPCVFEGLGVGNVQTFRMVGETMMVEDCNRGANL
jgi:ABC-type branched-subunit amino acid transport system ATPase component